MPEDPPAVQDVKISIHKLELPMPARATVRWVTFPAEELPALAAKLVLRWRLTG